MKVTMIAIWSVLFLATGYALFHITFQVAELEEELAALNRDILAEQESVHVLNAEWTYLNRPDRIEKLADTLLPELERVRPVQIMHFEALPLKPEPAVPEDGESDPGPMSRFLSGAAEALPAAWRRTSE